MSASGYPQTPAAARIAELEGHLRSLGRQLDDADAELAVLRHEVAQLLCTATSLADGWRGEAERHQKTRERLALLASQLYDDGSRPGQAGPNPWPEEVA